MATLHNKPLKVDNSSSQRGDSEIVLMSLLAKRCTSPRQGLEFVAAAPVYKVQSTLSAREAIKLKYVA